MICQGKSEVNLIKKMKHRKKSKKMMNEKRNEISKGKAK